MSKKDNNKLKEEYYKAFENCVDYIQIYDNALSKNECLLLIDLFEKFYKKGLTSKGKTSAHFHLDENNIENIKSKNSNDIYLNQLKTKDKETKNLVSKLYKKLNYYISDYIVKVGLINPNFAGTGIEFFKKTYMKYKKTPPEHINDGYHLQEVCLRKYDKKVGGYHKMHTDINHRTLSRVAAGVLYLNTVKSGGETKFPILGRKVKPIAGRYVVFPPYYTHMHYGEIAKSNDRYIIATHVRHSNVEINLINKEKGKE